MQLTDILLNDGLVSESQLTAAYDEHQRDGRSLGRVLVDQGVLSESQLVAALAQQIGLPFVDLTEYPVDGSADRPRARRRSAAATSRCRSAIEDGRLLVAMADPANVFALDDIRSITGMDVTPGRRDQGPTCSPRSTATTGPTPTSTTSPASMDVDEEDDDLVQRQGGRRGRADRQVRQPADHPGDPGPRLRHPHRADRARPAGPLPHRRRAARGHALAQERSSPASSAGSRSWPTSTSPSGASRRTAGSRSTPTARRSTCASRPCRRCGARRSSCESWTTRRPGSSLADLGFGDANYERYSQELHQALRDDPGHRPDRFGQVDHAVRDAEHRQQARGQRHHGRGPGRVPAARHQPGADQRQGRPDLRLGAALDPALGPRRRADR